MGRFACRYESLHSRSPYGTEQLGHEPPLVKSLADLEAVSLSGDSPLVTSPRGTAPDGTWHFNAPGPISQTPFD
ncbi:hypothetical protein AK812_SmicGene38561 [Symbiodinium microadriaticum]|uniref:Uncharacterized protein n=1 Tax=Symbiodinium microadriaticum TaxID=2951 RepID=A0A1Q9CDF6_SYMMI|nr:hypothetical protein AK812_SmicGene38561 [Symbiodinium microadriaticum]